MPGSTSKCSCGHSAVIRLVEGGGLEVEGQRVAGSEGRRVGAAHVGVRRCVSMARALRRHGAGRLLGEN